MDGKSSTTIALTPEAFRRFWFRYLEYPTETNLTKYAETDPDASAALVGVEQEIAEYWPIMVEECNRDG